jgi:hypothetical protein
MDRSEQQEKTESQKALFGDADDQVMLATPEFTNTARLRDWLAALNERQDRAQRSRAWISAMNELQELCGLWGEGVNWLRMIKACFSENPQQISLYVVPHGDAAVDLNARRNVALLGLAASTAYDVRVEARLSYAVPERGVVIYEKTDAGGE